MDDLEQIRQWQQQERIDTPIEFPGKRYAVRELVGTSARYYVDLDNPDADPRDDPKWPRSLGLMPSQMKGWRKIGRAYRYVGNRPAD